MSPRSRALPLLALTLLVSPVLAQQGTGRKPAPTQAALFAKFARTMTNATLVGVFTDSSAPEGSEPHEETYTLGRVAKLADGDKWGFEAKIEYGGKSFTVPLQLDVFWPSRTARIDPNRPFKFTVANVGYGIVKRSFNDSDKIDRS